MENYYDLLGVSEEATKEEIKEAYHHLIKHFHPDKSKNKTATEKSKIIIEAYKTLSDNHKREEYDLMLKSNSEEINAEFTTDFDEDEQKVKVSKKSYSWMWLIIIPFLFLFIYAIISDKTTQNESDYLINPNIATNNQVPLKEDSNNPQLLPIKDYEGKECGKINDINKRNLCWVARAQEGNSSACEFIEENTYTKEHCWSIVGQFYNDSSYCDKINEQNDLKENCFLNVASKTGELKLCSRINSKNTLKKCIEDVYPIGLANALRLKNPTYCNEINSYDLYVFDGWTSEINNECIRRFVVLMKDEKLCIKVNDIRTKEALDYCYSVAASTIHNPEVCTLVSDAKSEEPNSYYQNCIDRVAYIINDPEMMHKNRRSMFNYLEDVNHCKMSYIANERDLCILNLAIDKQNPFRYNCFLIINDSIRDFCYTKSRLLDGFQGIVKSETALFDPDK
jgi:hypothetical protein